MSDLEKNGVDNAHESIAVIGVAGCYPGADTIVDLLGKLIGDAKGLGKTSIKEPTYCSEGIEPLDPLFFGFSTELGDRGCLDARLFLETAWHLLEQAGHTRKSLKQDYRASVGVFVGSAQQVGIADTGGMAAADVRQTERMADRVARFFEFDGPVVNVETAGSGAQAAIDEACRSLTSGNCKLAIAAGILPCISRAERPSPHREDALESRDLLLQEAGVGAVLLQPLSQAIAHGNTVLALIRPSPGRDGEGGATARAVELDSQAPLPQETARGSEIDPITACPTEVIVLSANTPDALRVLAWRLLGHIKRGPLGTAAPITSVASLADLAYTVQSCREEMRCRLAMVVTGFEQIVRGLEAYLLNKDAPAAIQKILGHTQAGLPITIYRGDIDKTTQVTSLLSGSAGDAMVKALLLAGDLDNLALCWVQGAKVDWKEFQGDKSPRKVVLPAYPFFISQQERKLLGEGVSWLDLSDSAPASQGIASASSSAVESALTAIWRELFGLERIGRHQNFFELGGDSQLGMHMIARVRDVMQLDLPLGYLYETPTIATMSEKITQMAVLSATPFAIAGADSDHDYEEGIIC